MEFAMALALTTVWAGGAFIDNHAGASGDEADRNSGSEEVFAAQEEVGLVNNGDGRRHGSSLTLPGFMRITGG